MKKSILIAAMAICFTALAEDKTFVLESQPSPKLSVRLYSTLETNDSPMNSITWITNIAWNRQPEEKPFPRTNDNTTLKIVTSNSWMSFINDGQPHEFKLSSKEIGRLTVSEHEVITTQTNKVCTTNFTAN